jgi:hypothetical protein
MGRRREAAGPADNRGRLAPLFTQDERRCENTGVRATAIRSNLGQ